MLVRDAVLLLVSIFLSLEAASNIYFFAKRDEIYYSKTEGNETVAGANNLNDTGDFNTRFGLPRLRIHPLFGWASSEGQGYNREGFYSPVDYPVRVGAKQFVIGVFGESVAFNFWHWNNTNNLISPYLQKNVATLADREIVVLNFAKEGYRTPQNLNTLTYFLLSDQKFDLVLNIGGYNEVTGTWTNYSQSVNPAFPTTSLLYALSSLTRADGLTRDAIKLYRAKYMQADALSCALAVCWIYLDSYGRYLESKSGLAKNAPKTYNQDRNVLFLPTANTSIRKTAFENLFADFWRRSVQLMHALSKASGAQYLHIIQPNQYIETDRVFSNIERTIAIRDNFPELGILRKGYSIMLEKAEALRNLGIPVTSAIHVFDQVKETVYRDNCCHFNQAGEAIFAKFLAREIARTLNHRGSDNLGPKNR